jgi:inorganic pyrophosphatase
MSTVADTLTKMVQLNSSQVKEVKDLHTGMETQAQEFFRRYNNVKARNETSDKVL